MLTQRLHWRLLQWCYHFHLKLILLAQWQVGSIEISVRVILAAANQAGQIEFARAKNFCWRPGLRFFLLDLPDKRCLLGSYLLYLLSFVTLICQISLIIRVKYRGSYFYVPISNRSLLVSLMKILVQLLLATFLFRTGIRRHLRTIFLRQRRLVLLAQLRDLLEVKFVLDRVHRVDWTTTKDVREATETYLW